MKTSVFLIFVMFLWSNLACAQTPNTKTDWWNIPYPTTFDKTQLRQQTRIRVQGNQFIEENGKPFIFRGVNITDPDKLQKQKQWQKGIFIELAENWGVNSIRIPVHPIAWRGRGKMEYLKLLDQAVVWANDLGIYLIFDWNSMGYLPTEQFQHPIYDTTIKETRDFWRTIAFRYQGIATVAIYDLFNEPTTIRNSLGRRNWSEWKELNESLIDHIYAIDNTAIPMVAGFDWAYDLTPLKESPIDRPGIAYAVHPYPQKVSPKEPTDANYFAQWQEVWGFAAKKYPLIASEIGWVQPDGFGAYVPIKDDGHYGPRIITFLTERNISWAVCCFDTEWAPTMISDWNFSPTEQGHFFKKVFNELQDATENPEVNLENE